MRYFQLLILSTLVLASCLTVKGQEFSPKISVSPSMGFQEENLNWSIAGKADGTTPNVLSELIWKQIKTENVGLNGHIDLYKGFYLNGGVHQMSVLAGNASDTDYSLDNRVQREGDYHDTFRSDKGKVFEWNTALGYQWFGKHRVKLNTQIGYVNKNQLFYLLDKNNDVLSSSQLQQGSSYHTKWYGWELAIAPHFQWHKWQFFMLTSYQILNYQAQANWVLISNFKHPVSFEHHANADAWKFQMDIGYQIYTDIMLHLSGHYATLQTAKGVDKLNYASGEVAYTRLNGVHSTNFGTFLGIEFKFK